MLRHEGYSGTSFTRDDCFAIWRRIQEACEKIIALNEEEAPETLNDGCVFCVKKTTCTALMANIAAGGLHTYGTLEDMVNARTLIKIQATATKKAVEELDNKIIDLMAAENKPILEADSGVARLRSRNERSIDAHRVKALVGEEAFARYGDETLTMGALDALLKDPAIPSEIRARVESIIVHSQGSVYLETKPKVNRNGRS
jgi:hypothetical protein